jgi:SAM-dependent methyltransferase
MLDPGTFEWVHEGLPAAPARVLEVGAGEGELAARLRDLGYEVSAIDPRGGAEGVEQLALIDLEAEDGSFDAAVAMLSLHHVDPLGASLARLAAAVRIGGVLLVDEFDTDAFDRRAAAWLLARWHRQGREVHGDAGALHADIRDHLHTVEEIRERLAVAGFTCGEIERIPYLHRWDLEPGLLGEEEESIGTGALPVTGARFSAIRG